MAGARNTAGGVHASVRPALCAALRGGLRLGRRRPGLVSHLVRPRRHLVCFGPAALCALPLPLVKHARGRWDHQAPPGYARALAQLAGARRPPALSPQRPPSCHRSRARRRRASAGDAGGSHPSPCPSRVDSLLLVSRACLFQPARRRCTASSGGAPVCCGHHSPLVPVSTPGLQKPASFSHTLCEHDPLARPGALH